MRWWLTAILICTLLPGCWVVRIGAQNPIPGMTTIAVVPFFNLTQEPNDVVDGRRFALAYFAELQKTPGFEVIPVGVAETAILKYKLDVRNPQDALELARLLKADAVVIGGVTDFHPYYPPRIGLQVDWYSPWAWSEDGSGGMGGQGNPNFGPECLSPVIMRGQSPAAEEAPANSPNSWEGASSLPAPQPTGAPAGPEFDPTQPLMSYTRLFDGADAALVNRLRDYLELRGDRRSGSWEGHLQRSEDFIRFTSHLMIVEMLSMHGGATKSQIVLKWRKYK